MSESNQAIGFSTIEEAIAEIRAGRMIVVVDDEDRENEGDLVMAAEKATPETINFMAKYGRGLICAPLTARRAEELDLEQMVRVNRDAMNTAFTVSVDHAQVSTGISAVERARTVQALVSADTLPTDLRRPGHIFPLKAMEGGVLRRAGHTEAAVDLAELAGLSPAGVICEIMDEDGTMARVPRLKEFCSKHGLKLVAIKDLIEYRMRTESLIKGEATVDLPTRHGDFVLKAYSNSVNSEVHLALVKGDVAGKSDVLVRVHSQCLTGDVFGSRRCDCGDQMASALQKIEKEGQGVFLYMQQEGRGIGLLNKLRAYGLQEQGRDTVEANEELGFPADLRDYGLGAQILAELGLSTIRLMTNNPRKITGLEGYGLKVVERVPIEVGHCDTNLRYLETKKEKLGHLLDWPGQQ